MNIPAYWGGFSSQLELEFASDQNFSRALALLEKDRFVGAAAALNDWMLSTSDPTLLRRGAALFDLARARRSIVHGDLQSALLTLERSIGSVPDAAFGAVADDFVVAGGSEVVLGKWLCNLARHNNFAETLIKAFGTAVRIGDIFDRLSPASCYSIISTMPAAAYADIARAKLLTQLQSLARSAIFDPRAPRLVEQLLDFLSVVRETDEDAPAILTIITTLGDPIISPAGTRIVTYQKIAVTLGLLPGEESDATAQRALVSWVETLSPHHRILLQEWLSGRNETEEVVPSLYPDTLRSKGNNQRFLQTRQMLRKLEQTPIVSVQVAESWLQQVCQTGLPNARLTLIQLRLSIRRGALSEETPLADAMPAASSEGVSLQSLLNTYPQHALRNGRVWRRFTEELGHKFIEGDAFATALHLVISSIVAEPAAACPGLRKLVVDIAGIAQPDDRRRLANIILEEFDRLSAAGISIVGMHAEILQRLLCPDGTEPGREFDALETLYPLYTSSPTFVHLWRLHATHLFLEGRLDDSATQRLRTQVETSGAGQNPDDAVVLVQLGHWDQALQLLEERNSDPRLSTNEQTAFAAAAMRLAITTARIGHPETARRALAYAMSFGEPLPSIVAVELGLLGDAPHRSQKFLELIAERKLLQIMARLLQLVDEPLVQLTLRDLPINFFITAKDWETLAATEQPSVAQCVVWRILEDNTSIPLLDKTVLTILLPHIKQSWKAARANVHRATISTLIKLFQARANIEWMQILASIATKPQTANEFGRTLLSSGLIWSDKLLSLGLHLGEWLSEDESNAILPEFPAAKLAEIASWKALTPSDLGQNLVGLTRILNLVAASNDTPNIVKLLSHFSKRVIPALSFECRPSIINSLQPLLAHVPADDQKTKLRNAKFSLFDLADGNDRIDASRLNETARLVYSQHRLLRLATATDAAGDGEWRATALEALAALGGDRDPFIFAVRLRIMFLLEQDEEAIRLAEGFAPSADKALRRLMADVLQRLQNQNKLRLLELAINLADRVGLPVEYLHALDIRYGYHSEAANEREARVISERRAFGTLVVLLKPKSGESQLSPTLENFGANNPTFADKDEPFASIDVALINGEQASGHAQNETAFNEPANESIILRDNAHNLVRTAETTPDNDSAPSGCVGGPAGIIESTPAPKPFIDEIAFAYLRRTPSAAFGGPMPEVRSKEEWLPQKLAVLSAQLTDLLTDLPQWNSPDIFQLRLASYLHAYVLPLLEESRAIPFKTALISVAEYLSAPHSGIEESARRLLNRLVPAVFNPLKVLAIEISSLTEAIVDDLSGTDEKLAKRSVEVLDHFASYAKAFKNTRQRIWLHFAANRFTELADILRDKNTKPLPISERRQLQKQLLSKCIAAAAAAKGNVLSEAIDAYVALVPGSAAPLIGDWLRFWSGLSSYPFVERLETLAMDGSALQTVLVAMNALSTDQQTALIASLPASVLVAADQWNLPGLKKDVLTHPISFITLLEGFSHRIIAGDARNVRMAAETFADKLLHNLPKPLQLACIGCLGDIVCALDIKGQKSPSLEVVCKVTVSAEELALAIAQGTKRYGPEIVSAIVRSRGNFGSKEQLEEIVPQLEGYGVYEEARAIVEPLLSRDETLNAAMANLRLSQALGNSESAERQARKIIASARGTRLSLMDRMRIFLVAPSLRRVKSKLVERIAGLKSSRLRIMRAQAAARASILLGDVEQTQALFATLSKFALVRFAPAEIGALLLLNDYAGAEAVATRFVERVASKHGEGKVGALETLGRLERFMQLAAILQRYCLNEGRDPTFLPEVIEVTLAICTNNICANLNPADARQAFSALQTILRAVLQAVKPDEETISTIVNTMLVVAGDNEILLGRLANLLTGQWHSSAGEIAGKALQLAELRLNASIAKDGVAYLPQPKPGSQVIPKKVPAAVNTLNVAALDLPRISRIAKALTTVLSLAERVNADHTIASYSTLGNKLLREAQRRGWSSHATLIGLANRILTTQETVDSALDFLVDGHGHSPRDLTLLRSLATGYLVQGQNARAKTLVLEGLQRTPNERLLLSMLARIHENDAEMDKALAIKAKLLNMLEGAVYQNSEKGDAVSEVLNLRNSISVQNFWIETAKVSRLVPQPQADQIKGVVFTSSYRCMVSGTINAVPLLELKKRGYHVVHLNSGTVDAQPTGHSLLDQFSSIIQGDGAFVRGARTNRALLFYNWTIDPENRNISANGLNFYQPIFERLTQQSRSYTLDFSSELIQNRLRSMIRTCDRALHVAERIRNEVAALGIPVRFISSNWQYPPYCTFRIACEAWGKQFDMSFVACSPGYESYFSNLGQRFSTTAAIVNMTRNPTSRAPFLPVVHKFHKWYAENQDVVRDAVAEINAQITADRAGSGSDLAPEALALLERIQKHRANGGKVVCAFGKIVYDLAVPYAGGPAHTDMADFINHTVEAAAKAPNTLVLVKPHPHELRYEIARNPREYFTDLIKVPKPDNVVYLGHRWFNIRDIVKMIDLGLLWNGTTSLELGASGIPAVMCDDWGPRDYPVGHATPRDRDHYEAMIRDPYIVTTDEDYRMRCIGLLKYLSTTDVMRPYRFATRGLVNVDVGPPKWHFEEIERYLNEGDPFVSALADDFMF